MSALETHCDELVEACKALVGLVEDRSATIAEARVAVDKIRLAESWLVGARRMLDPAFPVKRLQPDTLVVPERGDAVADWLKRRRDEYVLDSPPWTALDFVLDEYRYRADTGMTLVEEDDS